MNSEVYFQTPIWVEQQLEWVKPLNKICDGYIKEAKNLHKDNIKEQKGSDFGIVYTSSDFMFNVVGTKLVQTKLLGGAKGFVANFTLKIIN